MGVVEDLTHLERTFLNAYGRLQQARESGVQFELPNDRDDALEAAAYAVKSLAVTVSGPRVDNVFPFEEV
jgi:hypothetical protein